MTTQPPPAALTMAPGRVAYEAWCASHGRDEAWRLLHPLDQLAWAAAERASAESASDKAGWIALETFLRESAADAARGQGEYQHGKAFAFEAALAMLTKVLPPPPTSEK